MAGAYDHLFKILIIGNAGVGKSRFSRRFIGHFSPFFTLRGLAPPTAVAGLPCHACLQKELASQSPELLLLCASWWAGSIMLRFCDDSFDPNIGSTIGNTALKASTTALAAKSAWFFCLPTDPALPPCVWSWTGHPAANLSGRLRALRLLRPPALCGPLRQALTSR